MRLLGYWIAFMVLLVVFVPAFSLIYSPAYNVTPTQCECPTCPECPECPHIECPITECPECLIPIVAGSFTIMGHCFYEWDFDMVVCEFYLELVKYDGYKHVLVLPFSADRVYFAEFIDWDTLDMWGYGAEYLNETHSYIEIVESVRNSLWYYAHGYIWDIYYGRYITIYIVREDVYPPSVLS